jgi:hypothetical protein
MIPVDRAVHLGEGTEADPQGRLAWQIPPEEPPRGLSRCGVPVWSWAPRNGASGLAEAELDEDEPDEERHDTDHCDRPDQQGPEEYPLILRLGAGHERAPWWTSD